jgi:uncharacterized membrane protein
VPEETQTNPAQPPVDQSGISDNTAGALAYFTFIPAVIFLMVAPYNQKAFIRFHAWQSILLTVAAIVISVVLGIVLGILTFFLPFFLRGLLWGLIDLCWLGLWLLLVYNAFKGNLFKLPLIGDLAAKQAGV